MDTKNASAALDKAVATVGGVGRLARLLGVRQPAVSNWRRRGKIPAVQVIPIERATNGAVRREELRPDIYPADCS